MNNPSDNCISYTDLVNATKTDFNELKQKVECLEVAQFLTNAEKRQKSLLCPVLALAIESGFTTEFKIRQLPSQFEYLSIKAILRHKGLNENHNLIIFRMINAGIDLKLIARYFEVAKN